MLKKGWTNGGQKIRFVKSLARKDYYMIKFEFVKKSAISTKGTKFPIYCLVITKEGKKPVTFNFEFKRMFEFERFLNSIVQSDDDVSISIEDKFDDEK